MPTTKDCSIVKQVRLEFDARCAIDALTKDSKSTHLSYYYETFKHFIRYRSSLKERPLYFVSSSLPDSKYVSIWVHPGQLEKIEKIAQSDGVSVNRVLYTSIIHSLIDKNYLHSANA